jgi:hypothetical protein
MRNLSPLFSKNEDGFIGNLELTAAQKSLIQESKIKIREHLRSGIKGMIKSKHKSNVSPRFLSQGSSVYKTRNQPCVNPPQQIDHDLGCYLPLSIVEETKQPQIAANIFFEMVDSLLQEIVSTEGWQGVEKKNTCSRVMVNQEIHIDIPLYSIPDDEYDSIKEKTAAKGQMMESFSMASLSVDEWEVIKNQVLLAHREEGWISSDPRKLNEYFKKIFNVKGEQLRRICRYLKAWRDYKWPEGGGPSSIYLMILADSIVEESNPRRDDLAFLNVLKKIPLKIKSNVINPAEEEEEVIRIKSEDKECLLQFSKDFSKDLDDAVSVEMSSESACELIRKHLGNRFPVDSTLPFNPSKIRDEVLSTPIISSENREPNSRSRAG